MKLADYNQLAAASGNAAHTTQSWHILSWGNLVMQGKKCSHDYNKLMFSVGKAIAHYKPNTTTKHFQLRAELHIFSHIFLLLSSFFFFSPEHLSQILLYYSITKLYFNHLRDFFPKYSSVTNKDLYHHSFYISIDLFIMIMESPQFYFSLIK